MYATFTQTAYSDSACSVVEDVQILTYNCNDAFGIGSFVSHCSSTCDNTASTDDDNSEESDSSMDDKKLDAIVGLSSIIFILSFVTTAISVCTCISNRGSMMPLSRQSDSSKL